MKAARAISLMAQQALQRQDELLYGELTVVELKLLMGEPGQAIKSLNGLVLEYAKIQERARKQGKEERAQYLGMIMYTYNVALALIREEYGR